MSPEEREALEDQEMLDDLEHEELVLLAQKSIRERKIEEQQISNQELTSQADATELTSQAEAELIRRQTLQNMHVTIGTDTKTPETPPYLREGGGQITPNRFDPYIFNANCQTDRELLENYFRKDACDAETVTLREIKKPQVRCTMLQTDDGPANPFGDEEPVSIEPRAGQEPIP